MDINKHANLECVAGDFEEGEHEKLDEELLRQDDTLERTKTAPELGWEGNYVGDATNALWAHIQTWFNKSEDPELALRYSYPKYSAIVQASGMGKSRAVDELSKLRFVIPVNLRQPGSPGHPPGDGPAYEYLINSNSQQEAFLRSCSFLQALFLQTVLVLGNIREHPAAESFREYMNQGMQFGSHGESRTKFYEAVETNADVVYRTTYLTHLTDEYLSDAEGESLRYYTSPLREAFRKLCQALEDRSEDDRNLRERGTMDSEFQSSQCPSVVLAFDEAHNLTELSNDESWSCFGEVCRALRGLAEEPLFTLFLSTSMTLFSATGTSTSRRNIMVPFYLLGFDQFAAHIKLSKMAVTISQITSQEHFMAYGRPLWRPYYQLWTTSNVMEFTIHELLGGISDQDQTLSPEQKLACLAQRIPIEFFRAGYISNIEKKLVAHHMRVILMADDSLETIVTVTPSEPILSEAAYIMMNKPSFNPPDALGKILDEFPLRICDLEQLIVALLFTMARDKAVEPADDSPHDGHRWCSLTKLITSLFCTPPSASDDYVDAVTSRGWRFTAENTQLLESSLADTFSDSKVYFTHFLKVCEEEVLRVEFLMRLMLRGAAILCPNGLGGVDGIIPFLLAGEAVKSNNIGVIMFQVTNDTLYTDIPKANLFDAMNPRSLRVICPSADVPVIRIVFAPTATTPSLALVHHDFTNEAEESYTTYDFWVAGLSPDVLVPVTDEGPWRNILESSHRWKKIYSHGSKRVERLCKSMNPGVADDREFWENWCKDVPAL